MSLDLQLGQISVALCMPSGLCSFSTMHGEEVEKWEKLKGSFIEVSRRVVRARVDLLMNPVNGCVCVCVRETSVVVGDVGQKVQTVSCEVSKSWGGMCSMLTVVNPILLLHSGNMSGEYIVSVFTTHKTWGFGGDGCVGSWIVINISRCTHVTWSHGVWYVYTYPFC